jgi:hypothetical protein
MNYEQPYLLAHDHLLFLYTRGKDKAQAQHDRGTLCKETTLRVPASAACEYAQSKIRTFYRSDSKLMVSYKAIQQHVPQPAARLNTLTYDLLHRCLRNMCRGRSCLR